MSTFCFRNIAGTKALRVPRHKMFTYKETGLSHKARDNSIQRLSQTRPVSSKEITKRAPKASNQPPPVALPASEHGNGRKMKMDLPGFDPGTSCYSNIMQSRHSTDWATGPTHLPLAQSTLYQHNHLLTSSLIQPFPTPSPWKHLFPNISRTQLTPQQHKKRPKAKLAQLSTTKKKNIPLPIHFFPKGSQQATTGSGRRK